MNDQFKKITVIIENKVDSVENVYGDKKQTTLYYNDYIKKPNSKFSKDHIFMLCFLSPIDNKSFKKMKYHKCESKEFICMNYQYLLDGVIENCFAKAKGLKTKTFINDYMRCLGKASIYYRDGKQGKYTIMAISKEEKKLVLHLWKNHNEILSEILFRINSHNDEPFLCFNNENKSFFYSIYLTLITMDQKEVVNEPNLDQLEYFDEKYKKGINIRNFRFGDKNYKSHGKKGGTIGYLAHDLMKEYLNNPNDQNFIISDLIQELRKMFKNKHWLKKEIIGEDEIALIPEN